MTVLRPEKLQCPAPPRFVIASKFIAYAFVAGCIAGGCTSAAHVPALICPPAPTPVCNPGMFDKTLLDTTGRVGVVQSHITMLPAPPNSPAQDYAIAFVPGSSGTIALITSNRSGADADNATETQRLFSARYFGTTRFGAMHEVELGTVPTPVGTAFYSKADGLLYFSAKANNTDPDDYDLYTAKVEITDDSVMLRDAYPIHSVSAEGHFNSQPTLDPSGTHLFFVSDRPMGDGGTDLWYSERASVGAEWSTPLPLPEPVNSACDELSPCVPDFDSTTLYFASNGHETVGGYDLFKTHISNIGGSLRFSQPENLGKPINTSSDEVFPSFLNDTAFFWSSNAPASEAGMNLYTITRTLVNGIVAHGEVPAPGRIQAEHLAEDTTPPAPVLAPAPVPIPAPTLGPVEIIANVTRGMDNRPAAGADIFVRKDSVEIYNGTVPESGKIGFKVNRDTAYDVGAETEDAFFDVRHIDLHGFLGTTDTVNLHLPDTLVIRINFPFDDYAHPYEYTIDENGEPSTMAWQRALDLAAHSALVSLDKLRELVLIGNTDSLGTDAYNNRLGLERARFVAQELERRGVPAAIIRVESRGRTEPVERRTAEQDEIFRLRSRRVEFVKVFK